MICINTTQKDCINAVKESKLYSIIAGEITAGNDEVVAICFCYIDAKKDMQEVLLEFFDFERINRGVRHVVKPRTAENGAAEDRMS